ncbi:MAG: hypothetical protein M0004_13440 [Actinomycetota bacterium]|nr:hypothetical protein [Actinomycetota bacterium]
MTTSPSAQPEAAAAVIARLERYTPSCLRAEDWALAAAAVRAAVLGARPQDPEDAKGLASRLCLFLAGPSGWDRTAAPDLGRLLSRVAIDAHLARLAAAGKARKTRENHRADLQRIARAITGTTPTEARDRRRRQEPVGAVSRVAAALHASGCGIAAGAGAFVQLAGRPLRREDLEPLSGLNRTNAACARSGGAGTIPAPYELEALVGVVDLVNAVEEVAEKTPAETHRAPERARTSRPSRAAALRHARAAMAAAAEASSRPRIAEVDAAALAPGVAEAIETYRPKRLATAPWAELRPVWERLIVGFSPASRGAVGGPAAVLVGFLCWARARPGRPDPNAPLALEELLETGPGGSLIDAYDGHLHAEGVADSSRATRRAVLRRALRSLDPHTATTRIAYQPIAGPYSATECAALVRLARHQPSEARRRELSFVVGLGLGAGLDGRDLRNTDRSSFFDLELPGEAPLLAVRVGGSERPRTVVVRRAYEPLVREALASHDAARRGKSALILGRSATRRNITTPVMEHAVTARVGERVAIEVNRLRATWLVAAMCARVPLGTLLAAAGLRSARSLTDLLVHCPAPDPAEVAAAFARLDAALGTDERGRS